MGVNPKVTLDNLPMEKGMYGGFPLFPFYFLLIVNNDDCGDDDDSGHDSMTKTSKVNLHERIENCRQQICQHF